MDANLGQPCASDWTHSPHQLDRQVMKKIQLSLGIDHHQSVRLGHLRGNFREMLGACHADRDWKAKLRAHTTTYCSRDLRRRTEKVGASRNVSKGLVDGNPFDERSEIIKHIDGSIAQPLVIVESRTHIASTAGKGFGDLCFSQGCGLGLGFFRTLRGIHVWTPPVAMRTKREHPV